MERWIFSFFLMTAACDGGKDTAGGDTAAGSGDAALSDPGAGLGADDACDDFEGTPIDGATVYFVGEFAFDGDSVSGTERMLVFANPAWVDSGGADCTIAWGMSGSKDEPTASCGSCDYSLQVSGTVDVSLTDCPDDLVEGEEGFSNTYNVKLDGDVATFYFPSGDVLGQGEWSGSAVTFRSERTCQYY